MIKAHFYFIIILVILIISCKSDKKAVQETSTATKIIRTSPKATKENRLEKQSKPVERKTQKTIEFATAFASFLETIHYQDSINFQKYIDQARGLYIIEVPGAVPHFTHVKHISRFKRSYLNRPFFSIGEKVEETCALQNGLPRHSCAEIYKTKSGYEKEGCFVGPPQGFIKSTMWQYADLNKASQQNIEKTSPLLSRTVIHTASSFKFHFSQVNGQWKILFIDLSVPCSA